MINIYFSYDPATCFSLVGSRQGDHLQRSIYVVYNVHYIKTFIF